MADDPERFRQIDASNVGDHYRIDLAVDECLFLREYTSNKGYSFSDTNHWISNLKKKKGDGGYHYKAGAIRRAAQALSHALHPDWLAQATLVPVPPSRSKTDPEYDDRIVCVCNQIAIPQNAGQRVDVRELILQSETVRASHENPQDRPSVAELLEVYSIDENLAEPEPRILGIVDDVLTAGTHYRAVYTRLRERFPTAPIVGIFLARRVFPTDQALLEFMRDSES